MCVARAVLDSEGDDREDAAIIAAEALRSILEPEEDKDGNKDMEEV